MYFFKKGFPCPGGLWAPNRKDNAGPALEKSRFIF